MLFTFRLTDNQLFQSYLYSSFNLYFTRAFAIFTELHQGNESKMARRTKHHNITLRIQALKTNIQIHLAQLNRSVTTGVPNDRFYIFINAPNP